MKRLLLSEAILLGDTLKKRNCNMWLMRDNSCGCALGGAMLAVGIAKAWHESYASNPAWWSVFEDMWPWFTRDHCATISGMFADLCAGTGTIEDIAEYVRSIEPSDDESVTSDEPKVEEEWVKQLV